tara:strand:+ start:805 stop:1251 length:447 start_codon:yes stop_codon:yes gene_type:complete
MIFKRTFDQRFIHECLTQPHVWAAAKSDELPDIEDFKPPMTDRYIWVRAGNSGLILAVELAPKKYDIHLGLRRRVKGGCVKLLHKALIWFTEQHPDWEVLTTTVPSGNILAKGLALHFGFTIIGIDTTTLSQDGKPIELTMLKLDRSN